MIGELNGIWLENWWQEFGKAVSVQFISVSQSCPTLCDLINHSTPDLPVHHQLPEFIQTHVHGVGDAIQPSYPLSSTSPPTLNPSQHQRFSNESTLCMSGQCTRVLALASFLPKKSQGWSSEWIGWISLKSKGLSGGCSNTIVQKHQFLGAQPSSQSNSHPYMTTGKTIALTRRTLVGKVMPLLLNMLK